MQITWPTDIKTTQDSNDDSVPTLPTLPTDILSLASLTAVAFAIGYFLKYAGIHEGFDRLVRFYFQRELTDLICQELVKYNNKRFPDKLICRKHETNDSGTDPTRCINKDKRAPKEDIELLYIFYEFINRQENSWIIQRALFFSYMLKYRLSMNLIVFSIVGIVLNFMLLVSISQLDRFGYYSILPYIFFGVVLVSSLIISQRKIRTETINWVTKPQLKRIICDESSDLDNMLISRLHDTIDNSLSLSQRIILLILLYKT